MKKIFLIITNPSLGDISSVLSAHDASDVSIRVLFTQEGVRSLPLAAYSCEVLQEDVLTRNLVSTCPMVGYSDMLEEVYESDLVITV